MASRSNGQMPISRHPLFPLVAALWFAALLGLGSLAIRASVLERIVVALRLDLVIPAAAPPLGFTARMLLSLVLTFGGGLLGFVLARGLGRSAAASARRPRAARPVVVAASPDEAASPENEPEDDGEDLARLDAARADQPRRRRALTSGDDLAPPPLPSITSLPGTLPEAGMPPPRILNFGDLEPMPPLDVPADRTIDHADQGDSAPIPAPAAERRPAAPPALAPLPLATSAPVEGSAALRLRAAPLDSLGVVELVERFALALAARRHRTDAAPAPDAPAPFAMPAAMRSAAFDTPAPVDAARPPAFRTVAAAHDTAEDWGGEDADLPEDEFSSLLDMKPSVRPTIAPAAEADGASVQPVVIFPGQSLNHSALNHPGNAAGQVRAPGAAFGTSPVETEQALREALSALQRMSGAA